MEKSASAPVLTNEDYHIPCHGVGDTGHPNRVLMGPMSKDKGAYSSRINQIVRQAGKVPGPGHYVQHVPWDEGRTDHVIHAGNKFPNGNRDYKPMNKTPAPATYESKDFYLGKAITSSDIESRNPRILYGKIPKGKKRSFTDQAIKHGLKTVAPGHYDLSQKRGNKLDCASTTGQCKITLWSRELTRTAGKKPPEKEIGPDHYNPNHGAYEERQPIHAIPKAKAQNFLDKAVKEKWVDVRSKKEIPGPGTYNTQTYDDSKFSRGTRYLQLRGMSRSSLSGYF